LVSQPDPTGTIGDRREAARSPACCRRARERLRYRPATPRAGTRPARRMLLTRSSEEERHLSSRKPARPYIARLTSLRRFTCPRRAGRPAGVECRLDAGRGPGPHGGYDGTGTNSHSYRSYARSQGGPKHPIRVRRGNRAHSDSPCRVHRGGGFSCMRRCTKFIDLA
jgi:hypothetical protein